MNDEKPRPDRPVNGVIVTVIDGTGEPHTYVYQERDDDPADLEGWADLLRAITDQHGPTDGGRHARHRLYIRMEPGDKWEECVDIPAEIEHEGQNCAET